MASKVKPKTEKESKMCTDTECLIYKQETELLKKGVLHQHTEDFTLCSFARAARLIKK